MHILTTGNQSVTKTHSVLMACLLGGQEKRTEQLCSSYVTVELQTHETNCPKSFSDWLPLCSFHTEPILNKHSHTYNHTHTKSHRPMPIWCTQESTHTHSNTHSCSLFSRHAKTGVTATHGKWVPNRLEQMKKWTQHTHILSQSVPPFVCAPMSPSCLFVSVLQPKLMLFFTH